MTWTSYLVRSGFRSFRWVVLTSGTIAVSIFLLVTLMTGLKELTSPVQSEDSALRVITRHKASLGNLIPLRYLDTVRKLDGVEYAIPWTWFGGVYIDESADNFFARFATDPTLVFKVMTEAKVPDDQLQTFISAKDGCIVGRKTFEKFQETQGWAIGKKITIKGDIYPINLELTLCGIYKGGADETMLLFHDDYLAKLTGDRGQIGTVWVKARTAADIEPLIKKIDATFANSEAETKTETEKQFMLDFISMLGNIKLLISSICAVVVFVLLLVTASTVSMAIRERTREIAILKAIGFNSAMVFLLLMVECMTIAAIGGLGGVGFAKVLFGSIDITRATKGMLLNFDINLPIVSFALFISLLTGFVSGLAPAFAAARISVVQGLKTIE